jgi:hypothetical protein
VTEPSRFCIQVVCDKWKYLSIELLSDTCPPKKEFYNHHPNLVCKLTNWEALVVFDPIIEYLGNVICDAITIYVWIEPTPILSQLMVFFDPWNDTRNGCNIGHVMGIHLVPICLCNRIHELLPNKLFNVVLHQVTKTLPPLSTRQYIKHCCCQTFTSIRMDCKNKRLSYSLL